MKSKFFLFCATMIAGVLLALPGSLAWAQQCGDVNDDDAVTATDALSVLQAAVGQGVELICGTFVQLCWDLNADGICALAEDINDDNLCDALDCTILRECWDLDIDGFCDPVEDSNDDDLCDALDCVVPGPCGNGVVDAGEDCDQADLNGETCADQGLFGDGLACGAGCLFDTSVCSATRYENTGLGTVIDHETGLEWQKTDDAGGLTDKDNVYVWTDAPGGTAPNGPTFTVFLAGLNAPDGPGSSSSAGPTDTGCYAGHCDWRMPVIEELTTIIDCSFSNPCIDQTAFGPTASSPYWSSSTVDINPVNAWFVYFNGGNTSYNGKYFDYQVRAVRGGS